MGTIGQRVKRVAIFGVFAAAVAMLANEGRGLASEADAGSAGTEVDAGKPSDPHGAPVVGTSLDAGAPAPKPVCVAETARPVCDTWP